MANDLNLWQGIGRLGQDVKTSHMHDGREIANISIAVGWKSKDKEGIEWVNITAFGKLAEIIGKYLHKGSKIYISGKLKTDKYEKDGITRYSTKIIANQIQMLDSKPSDSDGYKKPEKTEAKVQYDESIGADELDEDDIVF